MRKIILIDIAHYCAIRSEKHSKGEKWGSKAINGYIIGYIEVRIDLPTRGPGVKS
jgi:hypothetical protein